MNSARHNRRHTAGGGRAPHGRVSWVSWSTTQPLWAGLALVPGAPLGSPTRTPRRARQPGFALITAIFVLVILATFAAFVVTFIAGAHASTAMAVQGVRGYEAARVGIEWAAFTLRDPQRTALPTDTPRDCFASPTALPLPPALGEFTLSVACTRFPASGSTPNYHDEGGRRIVQYRVTATATMGTPGAVDYVERQLEARIEVCRDPAADGPAYACE